MRKYVPLFLLVVFFVVIGVKYHFYSSTSAQSPNARRENRPPRRDIGSDSVKKMMNQFIKKAKKEDHAFTKFNRQDLIDALQSMPDVDTVKFIMGAYLDDVKGGRKAKPVIMMQIKDVTVQPGGVPKYRFSYLEGALCPPPDAPPCLSQLEEE